MKKIVLTLLIASLLSLILIPPALFTSSVYAQASLGTIQAPSGIPSTNNDPTAFVSDIVRNGIRLMLIVTFVAAFISIILAGFKFITGQGDPKEVSAAQSHLTWSIIGLVVVLVAFAIIRVAETFFRISIISNSFNLPTRLGS